MLLHLWKSALGVRTLSFHTLSFHTLGFCTSSSRFHNLGFRNLGFRNIGFHFLGPQDPIRLNSPGLGPVACQIAGIEFCYQPFPFFRILFETFAIEANSISNCFRNFCNRIEANSSSHFRAIFRFDFEFQSIQSWTQIRVTTRARAEIEHKFEPEFELELKSNTDSIQNSSSS